jgi:zinc transporter 1/2/3
VGTIFIIFIASALGVLPPLLANASPRVLQGSTFSSAKCFGAGVILTTALVHILPDATTDLTEVNEFPVAGALCLGAIFFIFFVEVLATAAFHNHDDGDDANNTRSRSGDEVPAFTDSTDVPYRPLSSGDRARSDSHVHAHTHARAHGHSHGDGPHDPHVHLSLNTLKGVEFENTQARLVAHLLELGIVVHSITIGIDLGLLSDRASVNALLAALCFHQFFEGIGLGAAIASAGISRTRALAFAALFAITTPLGIAIGISIEASFDAESARAKWVRGTLNALSAGLLIYVGLVNMLVPEFARADLRKAHKQRVLMAGFALFGYALMTAVANWA